MGLVFRGDAEITSLVRPQEWNDRRGGTQKMFFLMQSPLSDELTPLFMFSLRASHSISDQTRG